MKEHQPIIQRPAAGEQPTWPFGALGQGLKTAPEMTEDVAFGTGQRFRLGEEQPLHLEIYPTAGVVRLISADAKITLFRQAPPKASESEVVFDSPSVFLAIAATGAISLQIAPEKALSDAPQSPAGPLTRLGDTSHHLEERKLPQTQLQPGSEGYVTTPPAEPEKQRQPRVAYTGRLVHAPWFRETQRQKMPIAGFRLAVQGEDNTVSYHEIVAFGERADKLREMELEKGRTVSVIGFLHLVSKRTREGVKTTEEIRAAVIRQPGRPGQPKQS